MPLDQDAVTLADLDTPSTTYDLTAIRSSLRNQAISEAVGAVVLTRTAGDLGGSLAEGGLVYTGVTAEDSARVRAALAQAGIHPEQAWIYVEPEPLLPDLALVGSAVGLSLTMLLVAWASTRAQLLSLRPWVSRLSQLGVSKRWALRAVGTQYAALVALGAGAGLIGSLLPLLAAPLVLPGLAIVVPWWETGVLLACLALTVGLGGVLALRSLTYAEGAEAQVTF